MSTEEFMKECRLHNETQVKYVSNLIKDKMDNFTKNVQDLPSDLVLTPEEFWELLNVSNQSTFKIPEE